MIKEKLMNIMFNQRCINCKGFVFVINFHIVDQSKVEGLIVCPECKIKQKSYFLLKSIR